MGKEIPYVVCIWKDAWSDAVEGVYVKDAPDKHKPSMMEIRGWLVHEDEDGYSIFPERCIDPGDEYFRGRTFIPKAMVKSITPVKLSKPRTPKPKHTPSLPPPETA